jgi:sodium-dependent dicarboxylate transporter 2/3/5
MASYILKIELSSFSFRNTHFLGMVFFLDLVPGNPGVTITAAIAVVMALWWVTEALPLCNQFVTHYPFPIFGVLDGKVFQTHILIM